MELDSYVSVAEAAEMIGKSVNLVGKLARDGRLPGAQKIGGMGWLIPRDSVLNYRPQKQRGRTKAERLAAERKRLMGELTGPEVTPPTTPSLAALKAVALKGGGKE